MPEIGSMVQGLAQPILGEAQTLEDLIHLTIQLDALMWHHKFSAPVRQYLTHFPFQSPD